MIDDFDHAFSHDLTIALLEYGLDEANIIAVLGRYYGKFSGEEAVDLFASYDVPEEYARDILQKRVESLTKDQIEEIMNCIDEDLYPLMIPYMKDYSFEERMDMLDEFGIELPPKTGAKKAKDEPGKLFSAVAMTAAVAEGIKKGIEDATDKK